MQGRSHGVRPVVLVSAITASVVVHGALLIATLPGGNPGVPSNALPELRATLAAIPAPDRGPEQPTPVPPVLAAPPDRSPIALPAPERALPASPGAASRPSHLGVANVEVVAKPLTDRARLGDYLARQMSEFPAEIDRPVRLEQKIAVRYPQAALAQGREDAVAVWVIVDGSGSADEIHVTEGTEEFAAEVVAAVRAARFLPAEDNLKPIRFPIALQFDFRAGGTATAQAR